MKVAHIDEEALIELIAYMCDTTPEEAYNEHGWEYEQWLHDRFYEIYGIVVCRQLVPLLEVLLPLCHRARSVFNPTIVYSGFLTSTRVCG